MRLDERGTFRAALLDDLRQLADALFQAPAVCCRNDAHNLLLGRQRDFAFGQRGVGGVALLPQIFQGGRQCRDLLLLQVRSRVSSSPARSAKRGAFLQAFLLLRREALDFVNDRVNFLVQQPAANFAAR